MTKHVFKYASEVNHAWAQQNPDCDHGRTPKRTRRSGYGEIISQSFSKATLYSYDTPIAEFVRNKKGKVACLITTQKYSVTTSLNMPHKSDIPASVTTHVFNVKHVNHTTRGRAPETHGKDFHRLNIDDMAKRYADAMLSYSRCNVEYRARGYLAELSHIKTQAIDYCRFFGYHLPLSQFRDIEPALIEKVTARCERLKAQHEAREAAAKAERDRILENQRGAAMEWIAQGKRFYDAHNLICEFMKENEKSDPEISAYLEGQRALYLQDWREGRAVPGSFLNALKWWGVTRLRVRGDQIETSRGASFPLSHGVKAWPAIKACRDNAREFITNGHRINLGHFHIDKVDTTGTVYAGCHTVPFEEVATVAKQLGLEGA